MRILFVILTSYCLSAAGRVVLKKAKKEKLGERLALPVSGAPSR
jgi:hypothetical protein